MASLPLVYIIILNYNGAQVTLDWADSVLKINYPHFRVIVVDNASGDDSVALSAAFAGASWFQGAGVTVLRTRGKLAAHVWLLHSFILAMVFQAPLRCLQVRALTMLAAALAAWGVGLRKDDRSRLAGWGKSRWSALRPAGAELRA